MAEKEWLIEAHKKGEISISDILNKKLVESFMKMSMHSFDLNDAFEGLVPPVQPRMILIEGGIPEPYVKDWIDKMAGTSGMQFDAVKLSEKFAFSETSQQHGTMLQKLSYQRGQAKDQLVSIQNVKRAILNIESDLEKMGEQKQAFEDNDWDQVMGIFIDNYGGPDRSWTAFARNVPMVRMALTWFLRLKPEKAVPVKKFMERNYRLPSDPKEKEKMKKEIQKNKEELEKTISFNKKALLKRVDRLVEEKQMNPAIANYLKRREEEFWNWYLNYVDWLRKSDEQIRENLVQQKATLKMYMKWAAESIIHTKRMKMDLGEFEAKFPDMFMRYTPKAGVVMEYLFHAKNEKRRDLWKRTDPWVPVVLTQFVITYNPDLQNWKFMEMMITSHNGAMMINDVMAIENLANNPSTDFVHAMINEGAFTEAEIGKFFEADEIKELQNRDILHKPKEKSENKLAGIKEDFLTGFESFLNMFGLELPSGNDLFGLRKDLASGIAADIINKSIDDFKRSNGMLTD